MSDEQIAIRNAEVADIGLMAALAMSTADYLYPHLFGKHAERHVESLFHYTGTLNGYDKAHIVTVNGKAAGMAHGFSWRRQRVENLATYLAYVRVLRLRALKAGLIISGAPGWFGKAQEGEYYLYYLAVHADFQGRALGRRLLAHIEALARQEACRALSLDVKVSNAGAIALYHKFGFAIEHESAVNPLCPDIEHVYRMKKVF